MEIGFTLSSEEFRPMRLVEQAKRAEEAGFGFATISDHYHPWVEEQGNSPFAWSVIGGIAATTSTLRLATGVTCPLMRYQPALVAQMAATAADMMPGRFLLGLGIGEALNEHILARRWPAAAVRQDMLAEAIEIIRLLWQGGMRSYRGRYFEVENARIFTLPDRLPPILVAGAGPKAARLAAEKGDGFVSIVPDRALVETFENAGGRGKLKVGQMHVCWASTEEEGRRIAARTWPNSGVKGAANWELPLPEHFEQLASSLTEEQATAGVVCGSDPERHLAGLRAYEEAGFDVVSVHQIGPDQEAFFEGYASRVLPRFAAGGVRA